MFLLIAKPVWHSWCFFFRDKLRLNTCATHASLTRGSSRVCVWPSKFPSQPVSTRSTCENSERCSGPVLQFRSHYIRLGCASWSTLQLQTTSKSLLIKKTNHSLTQLSNRIFFLHNELHCTPIKLLVLLAKIKILCTNLWGSLNNAWPKKQDLNDKMIVCAKNTTTKLYHIDAEWSIPNECRRSHRKFQQNFKMPTSHELFFNILIKFLMLTFTICLSQPMKKWCIVSYLSSEQLIHFW